MKSVVNWAKFDQVGMSLSLVCAVHCLAIPILIPLLPFIAGSFIAGEAMESAVLTITLLIAGPTLFRGYLKHRKLRVPAIFILGLLFLALRPGTLEHHHHDHSQGVDILHFICAALAGLSLAMGHWLNLRLCKACTSCRKYAEQNQCHN